MGFFGRTLMGCCRNEPTGFVLGRQADNSIVGMRQLGGGIEFQPLSNSLSGSLEDSEKYPHIEADALCSTRTSQGRLQCATEDMTHP